MLYALFKYIISMLQASSDNFETVSFVDGQCAGIDFGHTMFLLTGNLKASLVLYASLVLC